jgi:hypothetical protein
MGVQPRVDLCLDWRRGSGNRPNRVSAPAARLRLAAQRGEYESLGIAAPLAMGPAAKQSTFPGDSHSPGAADRLLKSQPRSRMFGHVNWAGPRRPAWEVFFGFRQIFCNAVRILRMEKVETLVVTVPMASPKNPPGSEKCLEARRRLQAPGGEVASLNRTRLSGDINHLRRRG